MSDIVDDLTDSIEYLLRRYGWILLAAIATVLVLIAWLLPPPSKLVSLQANDVPLYSVLTSIASDVGLDLDLDTNLIAGGPRVTVHVRDYRLYDVMTCLCLHYGCTWKVRDGKLIVRMPTANATVNARVSNSVPCVVHRASYVTSVGGLNQ